MSVPGAIFQIVAQERGRNPHYKTQRENHSECFRVPSCRYRDRRQLIVKDAREGGHRNIQRIHVGQNRSFVLCDHPHAWYAMDTEVRRRVEFQVAFSINDQSVAGLLDSGLDIHSGSLGASEILP